MRSFLLIESTYLPCLANTYAVRGKTEVLRGGYRLDAQPRSLEEMLVLSMDNTSNTEARYANLETHS